MPASSFDYLFHTIAGYLLLFFKTAHPDNVHGQCNLVGPQCQPFEQETSAMPRMFMVAAVGWVLDVSFSEQQTCAIYIFSDNVHSRCSRVGS
jgi:hypothetical protein